MIKLSKASWKNILITTITILIILIVLLSKAYIREDTLQRQVNNAFGESLGLALGGLNIDYSKIDETSKVYHYSEVITGIGAAEGLIDFTSYKDVKGLSYTLYNLKLFLIQNYSSGSGFSFELEKQIDIYNLLLEIMLNPVDEDAITKLEEYIDSMR